MIITGIIISSTIIPFLLLLCLIYLQFDPFYFLLPSMESSIGKLSIILLRCVLLYFAVWNGWIVLVVTLTILVMEVHMLDLCILCCLKESISFQKSLLYQRRYQLSSDDSEILKRVFSMQKQQPVMQPLANDSHNLIQ